MPLGATEQHGPHLPLDTDTRIALAWADGLADRITGAVAAPALPYGSSGEHQAFPGTISIGREALSTVILELVRSAANDFERFVLLSGHAGNLEPVQTVCHQLADEGHQVLSLFPSWDDSTFGPVDAHAGRVETSLLLHLAPELVRLDMAEAGATAPVATLLDQMMAGGVQAVAPNGVLGDPTGASAAEGGRLLDDLLNRSEAKIARWSDN